MKKPCWVNISQRNTGEAILFLTKKKKTHTLRIKGLVYDDKENGSQKYIK